MEEKSGQWGWKEEHEWGHNTDEQGMTQSNSRF